MELRKKLFWGFSVIIIVACVLYLGSALKKSASAPTGGATQTVNLAPLLTAVKSPLLGGDAGKQVTSPQATFTDLSGKSQQTVLSYDLRAQGGVFSPSELVLAKGTRTQINFKAVDADYDLQIATPIGLYIVVKKGTVMPFGFSATTVGRYEFSCLKLCPNGSMKGVIIVK